MFDFSSSLGCMSCDNSLSSLTLLLPVQRAPLHLYCYISPFSPLTVKTFLFWCIQINLQASCSSWIAFWRFSPPLKAVRSAAVAVKWRWWFSTHEIILNYDVPPLSGFLACALSFFRLVLACCDVLSECWLKLNGRPANKISHMTFWYEYAGIPHRFYIHSTANNCQMPPATAHSNARHINAEN